MCSSQRLRRDDEDTDNLALMEYFYREAALNIYDKEQICSTVHGILGDLVKNISQYDQLFGDTLTAVGSVPAGLKVKQLDEFDFEVPVTICSKMFAELHWHNKNAGKKRRYYAANAKGNVHPSDTPLDPPPLGYCHVTLRQSCNCHCDCVDVRVNKDIIPILVKKRMRKSLKQAINRLHWKGKFLVCSDLPSKHKKNIN